METNGNEYKIESSSRDMKKIIWLVLGLLAVVIAVSATYYFTKVNSAATIESHPAEYTIAKGTSSRQIAEQLATRKLISNELVFRIYTILHDAGGKFETGDYALDSNMTMTQIVEILTHGRVVASARSLTIIEGWTNNQIAAYLVQQQVIKQPSDFTSALEQGQFDFQYNDVVKNLDYQGFLFPDTYLLDRSASVDVLVQKMLTNFQGKLTPKMLADMQASGKNLKDVVILASIIEKEIGRNKDVVTPADLIAMQNERELAASVFYNRLRVGMPLESDATVNYVVGRTSGYPTRADIQLKSPYNTYQVQGLPPGPISNPGIGSIMAAIYPASSDYLYFINKPDGEAVFAKTLAEHEANIAKYLNVK